MDLAESALSPVVYARQYTNKFHDSFIYTCMSQSYDPGLVGD